MNSFSFDMSVSNTYVMYVMLLLAFIIMHILLVSLESILDEL